MPLLYSIGYGNKAALPILDNLMARGDITDQSTQFWSSSFTLVDIRFSPKSRWLPEFRGYNLARKYEERYHHIQNLGNVNYNDPQKGIALKDPVTGLLQLRNLLSVRNCVILCGCKDVNKCHRRIVADLVDEQLPEVTIIEI